MKYLKMFTILVTMMLTACDNPSSTYTQGQAATSTHSQTAKEEKVFNYDYPQYGFSITSPCVLQNVGARSSDNFLLNLGGTIDENNPDKFAAYQVIVTRLPIGYKDYDKETLYKMEIDYLNSITKHFEKRKKIRFSYDELPGYELYSYHNGLQQKGVMFCYNNYCICLTVMSNDNLEQKYNKFTNGFKLLNQ